MQNWDFEAIRTPDFITDFNRIFLTPYRMRDGSAVEEGGSVSRQG